MSCPHDYTKRRGHSAPSGAVGFPDVVDCAVSHFCVADEATGFAKQRSCGRHRQVPATLCQHHRLVAPARYRSSTTSASLTFFRLYDHRFWHHADGADFGWTIEHRGGEQTEKENNHGREVPRWLVPAIEVAYNLPLVTTLRPRSRHAQIIEDLSRRNLAAGEHNRHSCPGVSTCADKVEILDFRMFCAWAEAQDVEE